MKDAENAVGATILPPEAVDDTPPAPEQDGIVVPVLGMILVVIAAWLVLRLLGVI